ncbi:hypothetical protein ACFQNE_12685 [Gordonia phosphorivorans]|uniref:Low molecular weight antigen MTB12-like C-terminal domain-containing protein n=1 Tax=Gordonia phosphorivorans TaxID=1056982 RepID=A0ABV6H664_9ACTN
MESANEDIQYGVDEYGVDGDGADGDGAGGTESAGSEVEAGAARSRRGRGVDWPTVLAAGGVSAIVSAIVLAIGLVGLLLTDVGQRSEVAATTPTVVNLGAATAPVAAPQVAAPTVLESSTAAAPDTAAAGEGPAGAGPTASDAGTPAASAPAAAGGPTAPTLGGFQSDMAVLGGGASTAEKAKLLEGGTAAVTPVNNQFRLAEQFRGVGVGYSLVGPVTQNANTATARFKLTAPGYAPTYSTLRWVWADGRWKLSNKSVCELAAYSQTPCNLR